jgi:hypothetical protein
VISLNRFNTRTLRKCFCDRTTVLPEMTFWGAIIIMSLPVLTYNEYGIVAQQLFKCLWQGAGESSNGLSVQFRERAVFLYGIKVSIVSAATMTNFCLPAEVRKPVWSYLPSRCPPTTP